MMKDTPIKIFGHICYRNEALLKTYKFRIASSDSQRMLDKNFSVCFLSPDEGSLFIALNEKTYDTNKIKQKNRVSRIIYLSDRKKISILSCEEDEEECITRILGKVYNLQNQLR